MKEIVVNEENQEVGVEGKKVKLRYDISFLLYIYIYCTYKNVSYDNLISNDKKNIKIIFLNTK